VILLVVALGCGAYWYSEWLDRVEYLRWFSSRQQDLSHIGQRVLAFAARNGGRVPESVEALVGACLVAQDEFTFVDPVRNVLVRRRLRPVPLPQPSDELILLVETYDPPGELVNVLRASGRVAGERNLENLIERDNTLRQERGLGAVP
jgi:hypothetical protein